MYRIACMKKLRVQCTRLCQESKYIRISSIHLSRCLPLIYQQHKIEQKDLFEIKLMVCCCQKISYLVLNSSLKTLEPYHDIEISLLMILEILSLKAFIILVESTQLFSKLLIGISLHGINFASLRLKIHIIQFFLTPVQLPQLKI